jgi:hypothetical protein
VIAFTAAVLGGIGNLAGAVVGALVIGFVQSFNEGLTWLAPGGDWTRSIVFGILIAVLVFRPEGILGEQTPGGRMTGLTDRAKGLGGSRNVWLVPALILLGIIYPFIEEGSPTSR